MVFALPASALMARQSTIYLFNCWFLDVNHNHTVNFDNETNQLLCYDKKVNQNFYIPFENLQKANTWIAEKLKGIY